MRGAFIASLILGTAGDECSYFCGCETSSVMLMQMSVLTCVVFRSFACILAAVLCALWRFTFCSDPETQVFYSNDLLFNFYDFIMKIYYSRHIIWRNDDQ